MFFFGRRRGFTICQQGRHARLVREWRTKDLRLWDDLQICLRTLLDDSLTVSSFQRLEPGREHYHFVCLFAPDCFGKYPKTSSHVLKCFRTCVPKIVWRHSRLYGFKSKEPKDTRKKCVATFPFSRVAAPFSMRLPKWATLKVQHHRKFTTADLSLHVWWWIL